MPVAARRATENVRRRTRRYVECVFLAQRSRYGRIRVRSRGFMDNPGLGSTPGREILDHVDLADDPRYIAVFHDHRDILVIEHGLHGGE